MLLKWIFAASFFAVVAGDTSAYIFCLTAGGSWEAPAKGPPICRGYNARFESKTKKEAEDACAYKVPFDVVGVKTGWPTLCDFEVRASCPDDWIQIDHECYRANSVLIYQHQARAVCKNITGVDGTLFKLTSTRLQWEIYAAFTNLPGLWMDVEGKRNEKGDLESSLGQLYKWRRPRHTIDTGGSTETHQLMAITQAGVWEVGAHQILYDVPNSVKAMALCKFKPTPSMKSFQETSDILNSIGMKSNVYNNMMLVSFPSMFRFEKDPQNENQISPADLHDKCKSLCEPFGMPCYAAVPNANNAKDMLDFMKKNEIKYALTPILRSTVPKASGDCSQDGGGAARNQFSGVDPLLTKDPLPVSYWKNGPKDACSAIPRVGVLFHEKQEQFFESIPVVEARLICATASEDTAIKSCSKRAIFYDGKCKCKPGFTDANDQANGLSGPRGVKCFSCDYPKDKIILGVVFDSSGSIGTRRFGDTILPFVERLYRAMFGNYVILTRFSTEAQAVDFSEKKDVEAAAREISSLFQWDDGWTMVEKGITETHNIMKRWKGKSPNSPQHLILMTDGDPNHLPETLDAVAALRADGVKMQTVFIKGSYASKIDRAKLVQCGDPNAENSICGLTEVPFEEMKKRSEELSNRLLMKVCDKDDSATGG
ncbi:unnamed protein product [Caenorhabditis auriculariae]|uniref:VWFA domain-containing protein n=1 Tax=Caenorhabditis auriculariae TaxID=2777116 RepID=A0A8S1HW61_9PELO|nr:unnamed protein product [Caenorhabditis auriculariae]